MPTVPTADEILDRSFRRAAKKRKEKINKDRANEEFVRAVGAAIHDRLVYIIRGFPEFDEIPPFYREMADILYGIDKIKQSLGAVGWAAKHTKMVGHEIAVQSRSSTETLVLRKRAVARLASMVHQIDKDLRFLNEVRNTLRKLPHIEDAFTVVIAGYPNVGKSSFIRLVSSATPEIASYPFTTKGVIVGLRGAGTGPDPVRGHPGHPRPACRGEKPDRAAGTLRDDERGKRDPLHPRPVRALRVSRWRCSCGFSMK